MDTRILAPNGDGPASPLTSPAEPCLSSAPQAAGANRPWRGHGRLLALGLGASLVAGTVVGRAQFASRVTLVEVYATVTTPAGRPVVTLTADDFRVRENRVPRPIEAFAAGSFPLSVALAVDHSWSMAGAPLRHAKSAARLFLEELQPADEAMVIGIADEVRTLAPLSRDRIVQLAAVDAIAPWGSTRLYDALVEAHRHIEPRPGRRALVVLSDGDDRGSVMEGRAVIDRLGRGEVLIYPVVIGRHPATVLDRLASLTGGRTVRVTRPGDLGSALGEIAAELRHQYLIGFSPLPAASGRPEWRTIEVEVPGRDVRVRARAGYQVGADALP